MAGEIRVQGDRLTWLSGLSQRPWEHDFYQVLRRVEALHPELPRLGDARRPSDEPVRLGQEPELSFAPANVWRVSMRDDGRVRIGVRFLGLWGPQGPLPLHLTEVARDRERQHGDHTLARFADVFHHRLLLGFYRAWRLAQPTVSRDRPSEDRFRTYVGSTFGQGSPSFFDRDSVPDDAKRHFAGLLSRVSRSADGLRDILGGYFQQPASVESFAPAWMKLPVSQRSRLGNRDGSATLGQGAVLGNRVWDVQHHVGLNLGPLPLHAYCAFLPGGDWHRQLRDWVLHYADETLGFETRLSLRAEQVPALRLGGPTPDAKAGAARLGWTTWLGGWRKPTPASGARMTLSRLAD